MQSNDHAVFSVLDTGAREVVTWAFDVRTPDVRPWVIDRVAVGWRAGAPDKEAT